MHHACTRQAQPQRLQQVAMTHPDPCLLPEIPTPLLLKPGCRRDMDTRDSQLREWLAAASSCTPTSCDGVPT
jgi:hypothetical protein